MRVGENVYYAKRINDINAEIGEYSEPKEIVTRFNYFTCMPSGTGYVQGVKDGGKATNMWNCVANARVFRGTFNIGDLFWVDGEKPPKKEELNELYGYAESATAEIVDVADLNFSLTITLQRNQKQEK